MSLNWGPRILCGAAATPQRNAFLRCIFLHYPLALRLLLLSVHIVQGYDVGLHGIIVQRLLALIRNSHMRCLRQVLLEAHERIQVCCDLFI